MKKHGNNQNNRQLVVHSGLRAGKEADVEFECYSLEIRNPVYVIGRSCAPLHGEKGPSERRDVSLRVLV